MGTQGEDGNGVLSRCRAGTARPGLSASSPARFCDPRTADRFGLSYKCRSTGSSCVMCCVEKPIADPGRKRGAQLSDARHGQETREGRLGMPYALGLGMPAENCTGLSSPNQVSL